MKYDVYMNAGVEWWGEIEAESKDEAQDMGYQLCRDQLGNLRDYNFDCEVKPRQ